MENNTSTSQPTTTPIIPPPQAQPEVNAEIKVSSLYDQGFNKKTMFFQYFFSRIWPPLKRHTEEVAFFLFKVFRSFVKFAMTQIGIRS